MHQVLVISVSVFSEDTLHTNHARTCLCLKVKRSVSVRRFSEGCLICFSASSPINFCVTPSRFPNRGRSHSSKRCWRRTTCSGSAAIWTSRVFFFIYWSLFKVTHRFIPVCLTVPHMFSASLQECLCLQLHSPGRLEAGLFWRHHALRRIRTHRLVLLRLIKVHTSPKCI